MKDLWNSLKSIVPTINREGYPFIAIFIAVTVVLGFFSTSLFWIGVGLTLWCVLFFRDPQRVTPLKEGLVVAPADGRISFIGQAIPPQELGLGSSDLLRVSIFMNVFNCHVNRAPVSGRITHIAYKPGRFLNADLDKASEDNERNGLVIEASGQSFGVVQIAGLIARRIVCWSQEGDEIDVGQRFGMIRFGSRVDLYLPASYAPIIAVGQTTIAGETVLAHHVEQDVAPALTHLS